MCGVIFPSPETKVYTGRVKNVSPHSLDANCSTLIKLRHKKILRERGRDETTISEIKVDVGTFRKIEVSVHVLPGPKYYTFSLSFCLGLCSCLSFFDIVKRKEIFARKDFSI